MEDKKVFFRKTFIIVFLLLVIFSVISILFNNTNSIGFVVFLVAFASIFAFAVFKLGRKVTIESDEVKQSRYIQDEEYEVYELEKTKTCPVCNTENIVNRKYCKKCQTNIQNKVCPVCDTKNPHSAKYCANCDSILQNVTRH